MKKIYFIPQTEIMQLRAFMVLCASGEEIINPEDKSKGKPGLDAF